MRVAFDPGLPERGGSYGTRDGSDARSDARQKSCQIHAHY